MLINVANSDKTRVNGDILRPPSIGKPSAAMTRQCNQDIRTTPGEESIGAHGFRRQQILLIDSTKVKAAVERRETRYGVVFETRTGPLLRGPMRMANATRYFASPDSGDGKIYLAAENGPDYEELTVNDIGGSIVAAPGHVDPRIRSANRRATAVVF